jgi:hypothetical protein
MTTVSATIGQGDDAHRLVRVGAWNFTVWEALVDDEPRIRDLDAGERLGFTRPRNIRKLIRSGRKIAELHKRSTVERYEIRPGIEHPGQPTDEFWLTEAQVLKLCARTETPIAEPILDDMIRVYIAVRRGLLGLHALDATAVRAIAKQVAAAAVAPLQQEIAELRTLLTAGQTTAPRAERADTGLKQEAPICGWIAITAAVAKTLDLTLSTKTVQRYAQPGRPNRLPVFQYDNGGVYLTPSALELWAAARSMPLGARHRISP